ncbi:Auxin-induced protein [Musa troglodytarum]|uniref:WAT1-related protein n=1 Tax=Musa troglodytarum TaxID=320322 RepID=A0A9E7FDU8_9LILI|nr:Auxin-induced protein [Musa troglodytarum]
MGVGEVWRSVRPYLAMVFLQFGYAGMYVVSVVSLKQGMSHYVLVVYRNAIAAVVVGPFALWFERKGRPKMTLPIFLKIMALALLEPVLDQNFYYMGTKATSASFSSALYNILPAVTFVNAIILRMEKVDIKKRRSQAKIFGTAVTVLGALIMILYKGPIMEFVWNRGRHHRAESAAQSDAHWLAGTFMLLFSCFCWSAFFILQVIVFHLLSLSLSLSLSDCVGHVKEPSTHFVRGNWAVQSHTLKSYPAELSLSTLICVFGAGQGGAVALFMERGVKPWSIGFDMRLFTAIYSALVMKERGPVFVTAFSPLCMIIVAFMGTTILAEEISLGRVIGAVVIVFGLYSLIWGKSADHLSPQSTDNSGGKKHGALELPKSVDDATAANSVDFVAIVDIPPAKKP